MFFYIFIVRLMFLLQGIGLVNSYFLEGALERSVSLPKVSDAVVEKKATTPPQSTITTAKIEQKNNKVERVSSTPTSVGHHVPEKRKSASVLPKLT